MRALFFLNSFIGGGAEKVCLNLAEQLYMSGIESDFVIIYDAKADYNIPEYVHVYSLRIKDKPWACWRMIKWISKVNDFLKNKEYVLITAHLQPSQLFASLTKVGRKCFYVMHVSEHLASGNRSWFYKTTLRIFLKSKKVITVSKGLEKELNVEYKIRLQNLLTIYNPCIVNKEETELNLVFPYEKPYILALGRLEEQKNPLLILELYYEGGFFKKYDLVFLGKGSLRDDIVRMVDKQNLREHVFLAGFQRDTVRWIKNASLLLSCSKREGLPMNLIEALMCGTPVVAADCPHGPNEILTGELSKYLIYPDKNLDESISVVWSALDSYPEITEKYYDKFNVKTITQTYLNKWKEYFER